MSTHKICFLGNIRNILILSGWDFLLHVPLRNLLLLPSCLSKFCSEAEYIQRKIPPLVYQHRKTSDSRSVPLHMLSKTTKNIFKNIYNEVRTIF